MVKKLNSEEINIAPLISVRDLLTNMIKEADNEYEQMGAVQAFEIAYELAWKTLKKVLENQGLGEVYSPKEIFRKSYLEGLINDFDRWNDYLKTRNLTVHTYNEDVLYDVWAILPKFLKDLNLLIKKITPYVKNGK